MSWMKEIAGLNFNFKGSTLIAVRKEMPSEVRRLFGYVNVGSREKTYFSVYWAEGDCGFFDTINFDTQNWNLEIVNADTIFLKRVQPDPTHRGAWPNPNSDLYIILKARE